MEDIGGDSGAGASTGRGRGRGRGAGVPLLPQGLWEELNKPREHISNFDTSNFETSQFEDASTTEPMGSPTAVVGGADTVDLNSNSRNRVSSELEVPLSFGRGKFVSGGPVTGRGSFGRGGRGQGRGLQRDMKGPDWECPACTNVNWSWRSNCNKCNGPKPASILADNEVRDGAGGGFNERQGRVAMTSVEVGEDGFDDFGRRVKRAGVDAVSAGASEKNRLRREKELAALARLKTTYGFLLPSSAADETGDEGIMGDLAPGASKSGDQIGDDNGEMTHNNILQSLASKKVKELSDNRNSGAHDRPPLTKDSGNDRNQRDGKDRDLYRDRDRYDRDTSREGDRSKRDTNRDVDRHDREGKDHDRNRSRGQDLTDRQNRDIMEHDRERSRGQDSRDRDRDRNRDDNSRTHNRDREKDRDYRDSYKR